MDPHQYHTALVELIVRYCKEWEYKDAQFARACFPDNANPPQKWHRVKNEGQELSVIDLVRVARFFHRTPEQLAHDVSVEMSKSDQ